MDAMTEPQPICGLCEQPAVMGFNNIKEIMPTPDPKEPGMWWRNWEVINSKMHLRCQAHYGQGQEPPQMMPLNEITKHIEGEAQ